MLLLPRLELVFESTRRTVWYETASTISSSTSLAASRRSDQRACPIGGALQASATRWASWAPSSLRRYSRVGGRRFSAASTPCSTHCRRTRNTVGWLTSTASAMASSTQPGPPGAWSALSRIRAWVSLRAGAVPAAMSPLRYPRSASVNSTA